MIMLTSAILLNYDHTLKLSKYGVGDVFYVNPNSIQKITTREVLLETEDGTWAKDRMTEVQTDRDTFEVLESPSSIVIAIHRWYRGILEC